MAGLDLGLAGLDLGSAGLDSGSDVPDSASDSDGRVLVLAGLGLAGSDVRLVFTADRLSEGLSGDLSEALCSIRICTEVTATLTIRTEVIRITTKTIKKGSFQGPFYIGRMS